MDVFEEHGGSRMAIKEMQLHGPRPAALVVSRSSATIKKPAAAQKRNQPDPVVVYLRSPKVIHVRPEEFMEMVQLLTGNKSALPALSYDMASLPTSSDESGPGHGLCTTV